MAKNYRTTSHVINYTFSFLILFSLIETHSLAHTHSHSRIHIHVPFDSRKLNCRAEQSDAKHYIPNIYLNKP